MIAFTLFDRPIYRYGILYGITFLIGYYYLYWISNQSWLKKHTRLQDLFKNSLDLFFGIIVLGVIVGGRLGHVFLYDRGYYSQNLDQIISIWNGGMSFVGGFLGVMIGIFLLSWFRKLSWHEVFVLFDCIVFFLPLGILAGRIGNALNQELYGKIVQLQSLTGIIGQTMVENLFHGGVIKTYNNIDNQIRRNTNLFEGLYEGVIMIIFHIVVWGKKMITGILQPGMITGWFCVLYSIGRFFLETMRDNPPSEYRYGILKSQLLMVAMFGLGFGLILGRRKIKKNLTN
ncbi:MAG TPA: prolipoprotein diacylglyceryl transferase [Candidatus Absconditabacterales bacterium]|nr:prolipoprotein diacylglyceryl transferase [Candidatus Absconditabacterales bacterium]HNG96648.1 prolipoprotein diacylglyceryl transferase [Candidatus Absconditabacterales bacterium]